MMSAINRSPIEDRFAALPRQLRDERNPVFAEPWQAQAFALAVNLSERGYFTWKEWVAMFSDELSTAAQRGNPDDGSKYFIHWLNALERMLFQLNLTDPSALRDRKDAWVLAYETTPHGKPVELALEKHLNSSHIHQKLDEEV